MPGTGRTEVAALVAAYDTAVPGPAGSPANPFRAGEPLTSGQAGERGRMQWMGENSSGAGRKLPAAGPGLDVWFAGAQRGDPAAVDGLLRAVITEVVAREPGGELGAEDGEVGAGEDVREGTD